MLFMGSGPASEARVLHHVRRVLDCFDHLSGAQQVRDTADSKCAFNDVALEAEFMLRALARDLGFALPRPLEPEPPPAGKEDRHDWRQTTIAEVEELGVSSNAKISICRTCGLFRSEFFGPVPQGAAQDAYHHPSWGRGRWAWEGSLRRDGMLIVFPDCPPEEGWEEVSFGG